MKHKTIKTVSQNPKEEKTNTTKPTEKACVGGGSTKFSNHHACKQDGIDVLAKAKSEK